MTARYSWGLEGQAEAWAGTGAPAAAQNNKIQTYVSLTGQTTHRHKHMHRDKQTD